jgi:hypothetical protein
LLLEYDPQLNVRVCLSFPKTRPAVEYAVRRQQILVLQRGVKRARREGCPDSHVH